ncbi:heparan-alpha-glucosaminide N-acetyltransferase [Acidaminobacterium chupaoyuni]
MSFCSASMSNPMGASDSSARPRYYALDILRGLSILLMVLYHFAYDLELYGLIPHWLLYNPLLNFLEAFFASVFIAISGASSTFSHNNRRRGLRILCCAMAVTLATWFFDPAFYVKFGILHFLGIAALLYDALRPLLEKAKISPVFWLIGFAAAKYLTAPRYEVSGLWWLGFRGASFASSDYFPLLPWFFIYLFGTWLGRFVAEGKMPPWFYSLRSRFFETIGAHTLLVYLLHQPVAMGLTLLLVRLIG